MTSRDADSFDQWYDDMTRSEVRDGLFESVLGLPPPGWRTTRSTP